MPGTNDNRPQTAVPSSLRRGHVRSAALAAAVVGVVVLPIAAAEANPEHSGARPSVTGSPAAGAPATANALTPEYCGRELSGFGGKVSAQACVDYSASSITGTVYVDNASAKAQTVVINLLGPNAAEAQMSCTVAAGDANGVCVTGALTVSGKGSFDAVAEMLPVGEPVANGVLHVESGQVVPAAGKAAGTGSGASAAAAASPAA